MKKYILILVLTFLLALPLTACAANQAPSTELQGQERDQVMAYSEPIADNLLQGLAAGDYKTFSRDFNPKMSQAIDEKKFQALLNTLDSKIGKYQSRSLDKITDNGDMVTLTYKGVFSNAAAVQILLTLTKAEPHQVSGLYFK